LKNYLTWKLFSKVSEKTEVTEKQSIIMTKYCICQTKRYVHTCCSDHSLDTFLCKMMSQSI